MTIMVKNHGQKTTHYEVLNKVLRAVGFQPLANS